MWPFQPPPVPPPVPAEAALIERVEVLEDKLMRLERRFIKLQGEVTAAWRDRYESADEEPDYDGEG